MLWLQMGVKLLMSYLCSNVQNVRQIKARGCKDVIIYDALGCRERYFDRGSFIVDLQAMQKSVARDVCAFRNAGFRLIVVIDGGLDPEKYNTWSKRRHEELKSWHALNEYLKHARKGKAPTREKWCPPENHSQYLVEAFEDAGCEVIVSDQDADHVMACLAQRRQVYGVLTCDTDMLMFPEVDIYMDSNTLVFYGDGRIYAGHVARSQLARSLGLSEGELPGIAGILGNDVICGRNHSELRILASKWRSRCFVQAAGKEVASRAENLWPQTWRKALEYYTPVEPRRGGSIVSLKGYRLMVSKVNCLSSEQISNTSLYMTTQSTAVAPKGNNGVAHLLPVPISQILPLCDPILDMKLLFI